MKKNGYDYVSEYVSRRKHGSLISVNDIRKYLEKKNAHDPARFPAWVSGAVRKYELFLNNYEPSSVAGHKGRRVNVYIR